MSRQIIILSNRATDDGYLEGTIAFWLTTPATLLPYGPNTTFVSAVPDATTAELAALQNGTVTEQVETGKIPAAATSAQVEAQLQSVYGTLQANLNASAPALRFTGGTWDGSTWTGMP